MEKLSDKKIVDSWSKNVLPWVTAIREGEIESRLLITNKAIVDSVLERHPSSVLDVGCGEGWLVREVNNAGVDALGIDVIDGLVAHAQQQGGGRFTSLSFEALSNETIGETFDVIVCNFSLLGKESVEHLFKQFPLMLNDGGAVIIQTIHPVAACGENRYEDGWREGSWAGFSEEFSDPAPWYFRTLESWRKLFLDNGYTINKIVEPLHPDTGKPASVIFVGELK